MKIMVSFIDLSALPHNYYCKESARIRISESRLSRHMILEQFGGLMVLNLPDRTRGKLNKNL